MNQEKVDNAEDQKSLSIDTSKLETQQNYKEEQTDTNKEQPEEKSEIRDQSA